MSAWPMDLDSNFVPREDNMNPRVVLWLKASGMLPEHITPIDGETKRIEVDGAMCPWTIVYSEWIGVQWQGWAEVLEFYGPRAHEKALRAGYREATFDQWLKGKYGGS